VVQVKDRTRVQPDCVYVIPPNKDMSILHGMLHLLEPVSPRGLRLPIDFFLRSLAQDLGQRLGCGGHVSRLVRTRIGHFAIEDAVEAGDLETALSAGSGCRLQTIAEALRHLPQLPLGGPEAERLRHGLSVPGGAPEGPEGKWLAMAGAEAVAIVRFQPDTDAWKPEKVFASD